MVYYPELGISPELEPDAMSYFQTIISVLRWMIKLGRIDIVTEVSFLSSHVALPREGHLDAMLHVMAHVGQRYNSKLVYDPLYPEIDNMCDWSEFYREAKEAISMNTQEP